MYVFHWPLNELLGRPALAAMKRDGAGSTPIPVLYVVACALASLLLAMLSYHLFEQRFLALKPRFEAAPAGARPPRRA